MVLALGAPGVGPLLIVLAVVIIVFGPKRLPALARQLGSGLKEFRKSVGGGDDDDHDELDAGERGPQSTGGSSAARKPGDSAQRPNDR
jgi:sec-independent protein translocase protein TatA